MPKQIFQAVAALQTLADALPVAIFIKDAESKFLLMNKACEEQWGMNSSDLRGTDASQFFPPDQMELFLAKDQEVFAGGQQVDFEETFWNATLKQNRFGHTFKKPVYDEAGNPLYLICITVDITENRKANQALFLSEKKLRALFEMSPLGIARNAMDGTFIEANNAFLKILGYTLEELNKLSYWDVTPKRYAEQEALQLESLRTNAKYGPYEKEYINSKGQLVPVRLNGVQIIGSDGDESIWSIVEDITDIAERKLTEQALREAEERFRSSFDAAAIGMALVSIEGRFIDVNPALCNIVGYSYDELTQKTFQEITHPEDLDADLNYVNQLIANERISYQMEKRYFHKDGHIVWILLTGSTVRDEHGKLLYFVAQIQDITDRKHADEQIYQLAFFDPLTNLPNRRMFFDRLTLGLRQAERFGRSLAIMFLDLDNFKSINDTFGHDVGDELLKEVAIRLTSSVRSGDTVSRQGGDEFVIVLSEIAEPDDAVLVAEKIIASLGVPVHIAGREHQVTTSIGIAVYPVNGSDNALELMKKADDAMYAAKSAGRNGYKFFADSE